MSCSTVVVAVYWYSNTALTTFFCILKVYFGNILDNWYWVEEACYEHYFCNVLQISSSLSKLHSRQIMDVKPNTSSLSKTSSFFFGDVVDVDICSAPLNDCCSRKLESNHSQLGRPEPKNSTVPGKRVISKWVLCCSAIRQPFSHVVVVR